MALIFSAAVFFCMIMALLGTAAFMGDHNKKEYTASINKRCHDLGCTVISVESMETPKKKDISFEVSFVWTYGGRASSTLYKKVIYRTNDGTEKKCIVKIHKLFFFITSIIYEFE